MSTTPFYLVWVQKGPRTTEPIGYFTNKDVAATVASHSEGEVTEIIASSFNDYQAYTQAQLVVSALAKLTPAEKEALGIA